MCKFRSLGTFSNKLTSKNDWKIEISRNWIEIVVPNKWNIYILANIDSLFISCSVILFVWILKRNSCSWQSKYPWQDSSISCVCLYYSQTKLAHRAIKTIWHNLLTKYSNNKFSDRQIFFNGVSNNTRQWKVNVYTGEKRASLIR